MAADGNTNKRKFQQDDAAAGFQAYNQFNAGYDAAFVYRRSTNVC